MLLVARSVSFCIIFSVLPGVISAGARGGALLVNITDDLGGFIPQKFFIGFAFRRVLLRHFELLIILYHYLTKVSYLHFENLGVAAAEPHPLYRRDCN